MRHLLRILIIAIVAPSVARAAPVRPSPESNSTKLARLGAELAGLGDLENARRYCDSAITMEASNVAAAACLRDVASQEKAIGIEHSARAAQVVGARTQQLIAQAEAVRARVGWRGWRSLWATLQGDPVPVGTWSGTAPLDSGESRSQFGSQEGRRGQRLSEGICVAS